MGQSMCESVARVWPTWSVPDSLKNKDKNGQGVERNTIEVDRWGGGLVFMFYSTPPNLALYYFCCEMGVV